ncbi:hypothetical protein ABPG74_004862, partial [Tetrahymena malaccensis]
MNIFKPKNNNYYSRVIHSNQVQKQNYELVLRQLEVCLNLYKPHFQLEFKYMGANSDNSEFEFEERKYYFSLIVFDKEQNVKKKLVAFENNYKNEKRIKYYIDLLKYFPRKDLVYFLYDSYYLDQKKTFYIFELECPKNANFSNFMEYFGIVEDIVEKIKTTFCDQLIEFEKTQLVKQFRSKDKNKFNLLDQDYLLQIFSQKKMISYKISKIIEQMYIKQQEQLPLSFCFAQFEDFKKQQHSNQSSQDESQNGIQVEENIQQEDNFHNQEKPEELDKDSIYSFLFNEDSLFDEDGSINNLTKGDGDQNPEKNILCDFNNNQNIKLIDLHSSSLNALQQQEQVENYQQDFNQQNNFEFYQTQNFNAEMNQQEKNIQIDAFQKVYTNKIRQENKQDLKLETKELNENNSNNMQEDYGIEQFQDNQNSQEQEHVQVQEQEAEEQIDFGDGDEGSNISSYWNTDEDLLNQLLDFNERIYVKIKKENLIAKIKEFYSDILNYHQEEIFHMIQQHPKYDDFEVLSYDSEQFKLKCNKEKDQKILLAKKFSCFQKIQEEEKLINQQSNIINNLIVTEIVLQEKHSYLLVEYKYFQPNKQIYFYPTIEDLLRNLYNNRQTKLFIIELLTQISYELFNKYDIKITNICPSKIFVQGKINGNFNIIIQELSTQKFEQQYLDLIKSTKSYQGYKQFYESNCSSCLETLLNQFLNDLHIKPKQEIQNQYQEITQHIYLLKYINDTRELSIIKNNKFYKHFSSYYNVELTKDQQLVTYLVISFEDFFNWSQDVQQENIDLYNSLFKNEQKQLTLSIEQQEQFEKHFVKFSNSLQLEKNKKIEDNQTEKQNELELEIPSQNYFQENEEDNVEEEDKVILTELKNMLTIFFEHNLKRKTHFKMEIIKSNTFNFNECQIDYDYDYYNITSEFLKESSNILKVEVKKYNSQLTFYFAYVLEKILILEINNQNHFYYQELIKEDFSLYNIQILFKKMMINIKDNQNYNRNLKLNFRMLQKFDNLQKLILDLVNQDLVLQQTIKKFMSTYQYKEEQKQNPNQSLEQKNEATEITVNQGKLNEQNLHTFEDDLKDSEQINESKSIPIFYYRPKFQIKQQQIDKIGVIQQDQKLYNQMLKKQILQTQINQKEKACDQDDTSKSNNDSIIQKSSFDDKQTLSMLSDSQFYFQNQNSHQKSIFKDAFVNVSDSFNINEVNCNQTNDQKNEQLPDLKNQIKDEDQIIIERQGILNFIRNNYIFKNVGKLILRFFFCKQRQKSKQNEVLTKIQKQKIENHISQDLDILNFFKDMIFLKKAVMVLLRKDQLAVLKLIGFSPDILELDLKSYDPSSDKN